MKNKRKTILGDGLLFAAILALTVYAVFRDQDLEEVMEAIHSCDLRWIVLALLCVFAFIAFEAVILHLMLRSCRIALGQFKCFLVACAGFFFSAVTPTAGGGQPMQIYFLHREKVPIPVSAVILMASNITYKLVLVLTSLALALFRTRWLREHFGSLFFLFWLGLAITLTFTVLLFLLVYHPNLARSLADSLLQWLEKIHILRPRPDRREKLLSSMGIYHETASFFRAHPGTMILVQILSFLQRYALFTVPWLVCRSFGLTSRWLDIAPLQAAIVTAADLLPVPGGMGITEALFLTVFELIFGSFTLPAMVLSRGMDFYCKLLISAVFTAVAALVLGRGKKTDNAPGRQEPS